MLDVMPVAVLTGARQTGKSTLARSLTSQAEWGHATLDVPATLGLARSDPDAFVRQTPRLVIDEVQREPDLLLAVKLAVDGDRPRRPGRFLLTGSADLPLMKRVRESLAGRASYVTLHPLTRREQLGLGEAGIWSELLSEDPKGWRDLVLAQTAPYYVAILETSYQLHRLPAYTLSRTKQLVKSPKFYWSDVGLALFLAGEREPRGQHLENLVVQDLLAWRGARTGPAEVQYWRTAQGYEVDAVIEQSERLLPIEIKATTHPSTRDVASLRVFLDEYRDRTAAGLLLHTGDQTFWIASHVLAAPWWRAV